MCTDTTEEFEKYNDNSKENEAQQFYKTSKNALKESFTETQSKNNDMVGSASSIDLKKKYKGVLAENNK